MDATGPAALRFPLLARPRPSCLPLEHRVADLTQRARAAEQTDDSSAASTVFNLAALLASDIGLSDLARHWCHRHASIYLRTHPLGAPASRRALEPLINLARLRIRAGHGEHAFTLLEELFTAIANRTDATIDGLTLPAATLTDSSHTHHEIRRWLWARLLATGARALASAGRWNEACTRLRRYNGVGTRMLDGRQVAVIACATTADHDGALALIEDTQPGEPWEDAVTACLAVLCGGPSHQRFEQHIATLCDYMRQGVSASGLEVFHTRLGLSVIDALADVDHPARWAIAADLRHHVTASRDGYAAREFVAHEYCAGLLTGSQASDLTGVVRRCALGSRTIPAWLRTRVEEALDTSETVLTRALNRFGG
ncbi:hypothetical protein FHX37_2657 [Haloactinospora alba]|uniref:Uncharacterized protein n=1 Tax=Haloactinospora alba TaxID=405555 RepID=A0A543NLJ6_9ACTN|nr:hypothetical protein [Haloactinospora alba]TQN32679.1 hypothetical protein FHX37_2657 [Haloactinospora alba]